MDQRDLLLAVNAHKVRNCPQRRVGPLLINSERRYGNDRAEIRVFPKVKDEEYRYWHSLSASERIAAGHQVSVEGYRAYGFTADGRELRTVAVRFQREPR